ncbi:MAG: hypothetical protein KJ736_11285 [Candidatus Omnitrophica bacterium]|nr:hypothetical protein [Candidatus Omnitrophota bacterium]
MQINKNNSYSLVEIIAIVIIISVSAAFVIPNYSRSKEIAKERNANLNLVAIHSATLIYESKYSEFPQSGDLDHINMTLNLNIKDKNFIYYFESSDYSYIATAERLGNLYKLTATEADLSDNNPTCTDGIKNCPS